MTETTVQSPVVANFDKNTDAKDFKFGFKKDKLDNKRPTVEVKGPVPSVEGIIAILQAGGKGLALLQDAMYDVVRGAIGADVSDDEKYSQATLDAATLTFKNADGTETTLPKYSWEAIANQPKEDRRASSIDQATWEGFAKDYIEVMPGVTGKTAEAVTNATVVYLKKFSLVKTNKEVLSKLKDQLALYTEHSKNAEQYQEILDLLVSKADGYLGANDVELLVANL